MTKDLADPPFPWMKDKPDTYQYHIENDTGSLFEYTRGKRLDLGKTLLKFRRIYLDTKYWVYMRDVYMGRPQKPIHIDIFAELRRLRMSGSTLCPISYSVFEELMYQSDSQTRLATAKIIDEFSDNCVIQPLFDVFKAELFHFVRKCTSPNMKLYGVGQLVWTKAAFVVGDVFLSLEGSGLPEPQALAMRKSMDDLLWSTMLSEMIQALPVGDGTDQLNAKKLAKTLTIGKFEHRSDSHTFEELFLDEIAGVVDGVCRHLWGFNDASRT